MPRITQLDLGGSVNQGRAPSALGENEYTRLENFYQFGSKLIRRGGTRRLNSAAFAETITGLLTYRPDAAVAGGLDLAPGALTQFAKLSGSSIVAIPPQTGFAIASSTKQWTMLQYKNIWYGVRDQAGLIRSDGSYFGPAGIAAPTAAPTLADGGAGAIPAASFKGVYTFYNAGTNMESNPSPVSNTLALGANKKINWTGIAVSTNAQVTSRRLYRTLPDQSGEYFLVAEIPNNVDTTFVGDNVLAEDLGDAVSFVNGTPPPNLMFGAVWKERLFVSDGTTVFYSEDGLVEAFDPDADIPVFPDDGHPLRAIHAFGDRLVIGKTNKIHYLVGSDPETFALLTLSDRHGCVAHHTMHSAEGSLFWLGIDNVYRSDGNTVTGIASIKLRDVIARFNQGTLANASATILPQLGWYIIAFPGESAYWIYNYRTDVWTSYLIGPTVGFLGDFFDSNQNQSIYLVQGGSVYHVHDTSYARDDYGEVTGQIITGRAITRVIDTAGGKHIISRVGILSQRYAASIVLAIAGNDLVSDLPKTRSVSLDYAPRWKLYSLSTRHAARAQTQLIVVYQGDPAIELEGWALDVDAIDRPSMLAH